MKQNILLICFLWLCSCSSSIHFWSPEVFPCTWCSRFTGISIYKVRKAFKRLSFYGYVVLDHDGGFDDYSCNIWSLRGYRLTKKGLETSIYKKYEREELLRIQVSLNDWNKSE